MSSVIGKFDEFDAVVPYIWDCYLDSERQQYYIYIAFGNNAVIDADKMDNLFSKYDLDFKHNTIKGYLVSLDLGKYLFDRFKNKPIGKYQW